MRSQETNRKNLFCPDADASVLGTDVSFRNKLLSVVPKWDCHTCSRWNGGTRQWTQMEIRGWVGQVLKHLGLRSDSPTVVIRGVYMNCAGDMCRAKASTFSLNFEPVRGDTDLEAIGSVQQKVWASLV